MSNYKQVFMLSKNFGEIVKFSFHFIYLIRYHLFSGGVLNASGYNLFDSADVSRNFVYVLKREMFFNTSGTGEYADIY